MTTKQACWDDIVVLLVFFYSLVPHRRVIVIVGKGRGLEIFVNVAVLSPQNEATLKINKSNRRAFPTLFCTCSLLSVSCKNCLG